MKWALKCEKTIFFIIKIFIVIGVALIFFYNFLNQIPQLKTINRTSIVSYGIFFFSIFNLIKIFGGLKIGQMQPEEIKNSVILGTLIADLITFLAAFFMGISSTQYFEFYSNLTGKDITASKLENPLFSIFLKHYFKNKILPSLFILIFIILLQAIFIQISTKLSSKFYFKLNPPKKTIVIYEKLSDLIFLISKIQKKLKHVEPN